MNHENKPIESVQKQETPPVVEQKPKKKGNEPFVVPHGNRKFAITVISIFVAMLLLPTVAWGVLKALNTVNPSIMETVDFDTGENRAFATFPQKFNPQTVTSEIESWYNDHLPFRSVLYKTQEKLSLALEKPYDNGLRQQLILWFHGEDSEGTDQPVGGSEIKDIYQTEDIENTETETLPQFIPDDNEPTSCKHTYDDVSVTIQAATCTEYGIAGNTCTKCGHVGNKQYTAKLSHEYVSDVTEQLVCGTKYVETLTCSVCGDSNTSEKVKGHTAGKKLDVCEPTYLDYGYTLIQCKDCRTQYRIELSNKLYDHTYFPPIYRGTDAYEGRFQWMFYRGNNSEAYYMGTNLLSDAELANYASVLQQLNDLCKAKGIQFQVSIWPNKEQVYSEYMPNMNVVTEYKKVERLVDYVTENTDVNIIYPLAELTQAKPYWELYWPLDTHWNNAGAFIGYQAMLKSLGLETTSMTTLPIDIIYGNKQGAYVTDGQTSLLYGVKSDLLSIGGVSAKDYPTQKNYIVKYRPDVKVLSQKGPNGASDTRHTTSTGPNDLNFVMLADSYRVMQLTYLEKDFTDCFLTHRSHVGDADVIEAVRNADILVLASVERLEPEILATAKKLISILSSAD